MTTRTICTGCGNADGLDVVLDLGTTPLADSFPADPTEPQVYYPLRVQHCDRCDLVQLVDVVPDDVLYGKDYAFRSSTSPALTRYHRRYAQWLHQLTRPQDGLTVEIASNDGSLLAQIADLNHGHGQVLGVEPAGGAAADARGRGLPVVDRFFTSKLAQEIRGQHGPAYTVIANNVLAHVPDIRDVVAGISTLLATNGTAVVEFQYLPDVILHNAWDQVYHEHRYYLTVSALRPILDEYGLAAVQTIHTPMQGGSLRMVLRKDAWHSAISSDGPGAGRWVAGWQTQVDYHRRRLRAMVAELPRPVFGYGATAKGTTLLHYCGLTDALDAVIDLTPGKIGRYMPGTSIPVVAADDAQEARSLLVLAWNYLPAVLTREAAFLDRGGHMLVPMPAPLVISR